MRDRIEKKDILRREKVKLNRFVITIFLSLYICLLFYILRRIEHNQNCSMISGISQKVAVIVFARVLLKNKIRFWKLFLEVSLMHNIIVYLV